MCDLHERLSGQQTQDESTAALRLGFDKLHENSWTLASRMSFLRGRKPDDELAHRFEGMRGGTIPVSPEMAALVELLIRERDRAVIDSSKLNWSGLEYGGAIAVTRGFTLEINRNGGGWQISIHENAPRGYCHPWPINRSSLEDTKIYALIWLDDAIRHLQQMALTESATTTKDSR